MRHYNKIEKYNFKDLSENETRISDEEEKKFREDLFSIIKKYDKVFREGFCIEEKTTVHEKQDEVVKTVKNDDSDISKEGTVNIQNEIELNNIKENEFRRGYEEGKKEVTVELSNKHKEELLKVRKESEDSFIKLLQDIKELLKNLDNKKLDFIKEEQEIFYEMAIEVGRKLALRDISNSDNVHQIKEWIESVFKNISDEKKIVILVNERMKNKLVELLKMDAIIIVDNTLSDIDCKVLWDYGRVEYIMENRLKEIKDLLF